MWTNEDKRTLILEYKDDLECLIGFKERGIINDADLSKYLSSDNAGTDPSNVVDTAQKATQTLQSCKQTKKLKDAIALAKIMQLKKIPNNRDDLYTLLMSNNFVWVSNGKLRCWVFNK